jgi:hypothetical protein
VRHPDTGKERPLAARKQDIEVRINRHTLSIAGQIYQLRNIARVQTFEYRPFRARGFFRVLGRAFGFLVLLVLFNIAVNVATKGSLPSALQTFDTVALILLAVLTLILAVRALVRRSSYLLLLETNGASLGLLSSDRRRVIDNLVGEIANAMEDPPETPRIFHIGDVVLGDQTKQWGDHNIGKAMLGG